MYKFFLKNILFVFVFISFCVEARPFSEEKAEIDAYHPGGYAAMIERIYDYASEVIFENEEVSHDDEIIDQVVNLLVDDDVELDEDIMSDPMFQTLYGGLRLLEELECIDNPSAVDVIHAGDIASVLLSPQLFSVTSAEIKPSNVYQLAHRQRNNLKKAGQYFLGIIDGDEEMLFRQKKSANYQFLGKYFSPLICLHDNAVYSEEAFIYALSKGIFLFGLDHRVNDVHGGLYDNPAYLFMHDIAHLCELFRPCLGSEEEYLKVKNLYVSLAKYLYTQINNRQVFPKAERPLAVRAAFYILHENAFYLQLPRIAELEEGDIKAFLTIAVNCLRHTMLSRIGKVEGLRPLTEPKGGVSGHKRKNDLSDTDKRNASDYAKLMGDTFPNHEAQLFGIAPKGSEARNLNFHADLTLELTMNMISWFELKLI